MALCRQESLVGRVDILHVDPRLFEGDPIDLGNISGARVVGCEDEVDVSVVAVGEEAKQFGAGDDVLARVKCICTLHFGGGARHELHEPLRAHRTHGVGVEARLDLDDCLDEGDRHLEAGRRLADVGVVTARRARLRAARSRTPPGLRTGSRPSVRVAVDCRRSLACLRLGREDHGSVRLFVSVDVGMRRCRCRRCEQQPAERERPAQKAPCEQVAKGVHRHRRYYGKRFEGVPELRLRSARAQDR